MRPLLLLLAILTLAACREDLAGLPQPVPLTADSVGHYCQMDLLEHPGPKAQVHLKGLPDPLFFSQVRDAIAYQRMPEQSHAISVIYVNDMGAAPAWDRPGADNWINAAQAHYVTGSAAKGGMDAPELVPFLSSWQAEAFARAHGGRVVTLAQVADADVLAAGPVATAPDTAPDPASIGQPDEETDFRARLDRLSRERQN
jgi:copper chaperone NosL